jgi:hypothetical protein
MTEISPICTLQATGPSGSPYVRVRIEADELEEPQDLSIALSDVGTFVTLLLAWAARLGTGGRPARRRNRRFPTP